MAGSKLSSLKVSIRDGVATLELNLVEGHLSAEIHGALVEACASLDLDESLRAVVIRSRGADFCLGNDATVDQATFDGITAVAKLRVPCVAVLSGKVLDAGLELALACDLRIASPDVRLGLTQSPAGGLPGDGGTQRLPRIVGAACAARMLFLGEVLGGREAARIGLLQGLSQRGALARDLRSLVGRLRERAPIAQRLAKEALRAANDLSLAEGLRLEGDLYVLLQTTRDHAEGVTSFRDKRRPRFEGR